MVVFTCLWKHQTTLTADVEEVRRSGERVFELDGVKLHQRRA